MFANLVEGALQHTPENTTGQPALKRHAESHRQSRGQRAGRPARALRVDRQPFYRLEQSRTSPDNGLGLSLVTAIAELHGHRPSLPTTGRALPCPALSGGVGPVSARLGGCTVQPLQMAL
jgi:hypothetical protein